MTLHAVSSVSLVCRENNPAPISTASSPISNCIFTMFHGWKQPVRLSKDEEFQLASFKREATRVYQTYHAPKPNVSSSDREHIKKICQHTNVIVKPSDKSNKFASGNDRGYHGCSWLISKCPHCRCKYPHCRCKYPHCRCKYPHCRCKYPHCRWS